MSEIYTLSLHDALPIYAHAVIAQLLQALQRCLLEAPASLSTPGAVAATGASGGGGRLTHGHLHSLAHRECAQYIEFEFNFNIMSDDIDMRHRHAPGTH